MGRPADDPRARRRIGIDQRGQRAEDVGHVGVADAAFLGDEIGRAARDVAHIGAHDQHVGDFESAEQQRQHRRQDQRKFDRGHAVPGGADFPQCPQHPLNPVVNGSLRKETAE